METRARESDKTPPRILEAIVTLLTPRSLREDVLGDLRRKYKSPRQFVELAVSMLSELIPGRIRNSFDYALYTGQAFALSVSFAGAPFAVGLGGGVLLALLILSLRDAHTYPAETPAEAAMDSAVAVLSVVVTVIVMASVARAPALPAPIMGRGIVAGLLTLFFLRMFFRWVPGPPTDKPRAVAERSWRMASFMNVLWLAAWVALGFANRHAGTSLVDMAFLMIPMVIITIDYLLRQKEFARPRIDEGPKSLFENRDKTDLLWKLSVLWIPSGIRAEVLFFVAVVLILVAGIVGEADVDWLRFDTSVFALLMMFAVWRYIRKVNRSAARLIQAEIAALIS
jgi:hypothetical protein